MWCAADLTGTARLADDVTAASANLRPIRPSRVDDPHHRLGLRTGQARSTALFQLTTDFDDAH